MDRPQYSRRVQSTPVQEAQLATERNISQRARWARVHERLYYDPALKKAAECFRPEVFHHILYLYSQDALTEGLKEILGLSDPYGIAANLEEFMMKTSPLFSEMYQNQVRDRCRIYEDNHLGMRKADELVCSTAVIYQAVRMADNALRYFERLPLQQMDLSDNQDVAKKSLLSTLTGILSCPQKMARRLLKKKDQTEIQDQVRRGNARNETR